MRIFFKQLPIFRAANHADLNGGIGFFDFAKGKRANDVIADFAVLAQKQNGAQILRIGRERGLGCAV